MSQNQSPQCPACRALMTLAHITLGSNGYDVRTFECPECPRLLKKVVKLGDPMKSVITMGWLHSQLVAPT